MEKAPYNALASIDFVRYQSELEAYNYRCRNRPACSGCLPALLRHGVQTFECSSYARTVLLNFTSSSHRSNTLMASETPC